MKLNVIYKVLAAAAVVLCLSSCSGMLDKVSPKDKIPSDKLTENDLKLLTNGVLHQYEAFLNNVWYEGDYLAENFTGGPGFTYADVHGDTQSPSSAIPLSRWQYCYGKLNYANLLIQSAESSPNQSSPDVKTALGTGYFFRALIYFNLVQRYGGVPVIKSAGSTEIVPRSSEQEVWKMIKDDLDVAEEALPDFYSFAYPSKDACKLLRAKVCLWTGDNAAAAQNASEVIAGKSYELSGTSEDFASMFVFGTASKEIIFAPINIRSTDYIRLFASVNDTDGSYNYSPTEWCYNNLYSDDAVRKGDIRKSPTFSSEDPRPVIKFPNGQTGQFIDNADASQSPLMCLRLADAYLIKAEAEWAGGDIPAAVATMQFFVSSRYASVTLDSSMSTADFETLLLDENRREFYAEGHRWFDVKRIGQLHHASDFATWIDTQYSEWEGRDFLLYWPVPQVERDKSKGLYTQNPGYPGYND